MKTRMLVAAALAMSAVLTMGRLSVLAQMAPAAGAQPDGSAATNGHATTESPAESVTIDVDTTAAEEEKIDAVTLHLEDVDLADVVKMFVRITDANIIIGTNLQGKVSVHISDKPWKAALDAILLEKGLALYDPTGGGVYTIVTKQQGVPDPLVTDTIFLKFADVPSVVAVLRNAIDPRGKIAEFASRNAMVVQSTKANISELRMIVEQIDLPRKQVYIEARFMELSGNSGKDVGVNWSRMLTAYEVGGSAVVLDKEDSVVRSTTKDGSIVRSDTRTGTDNQVGSYSLIGSTVVPAGTRPTRDVTAGTALSQGATENLAENSGRIISDIRTAVLSPLTFSMILSAMESGGGLKILSNPKIIVANGEQAEIHVGEIRRPFMSQVVPPSQAAAGFTAYSPGEPVESGVKLKVTPTVNTDSNITVKIEPELSRFEGQEEAPSGQTYPIKVTRVVKTQFNLESGKTAVIGGLTETRDEKSNKSIPLLGDIPLVGKYLFSHESVDQVQREMIIFVTVGMATAETIEKTSGMPTEAELARKELITGRQRRQDFEDELESMEDSVRKRAEKAEKRRRLLLDRSR